MQLSAFIIAATAASGVFASPLGKRAMETVTETEIVYTTVTIGNGAEPSAFGSKNYGHGSNNGNGYGNGGSRGGGYGPPAQSDPEPTTSSVAETTQEEVVVETPPPAPEPYYPPPQNTPVEDTTPEEIPEEEPTPIEYVQEATPEVAPVETPAPQEPKEETPAPAPAPAPGSGSGNSMLEAALTHHNVHRANHSSPAMTWNDEIAGYAAITAATCNFAHDTQTGGGGYGQNIAMWASSNDVRELGEAAFIGRTVTEMWYNGEINLFPAGDYGKATPDMSNFHDWGHYTQVVWADSTTVGCHVQYCPPGTMVGGMSAYFSVCNYYPAGNVGGAYASNVNRPAGQSTYNAS